jgi:hypothetical protein
MHITTPYQTRVTLFSRSGGAWYYPSLAAARTTLGLDWISRYVAAHFRTYSHTKWRYADGSQNHYRRPETESRVFYTPVYHEASYIMRNDGGRPLTYADFYVPLRHAYRPKSRPWNGAGPVPGTRKPKAGCHRRRNVSYANAFRVAITFTDEGEVAARPKRTKSLIPSRWDYCEVHGRMDRSWKRFRSHQWK